MDELKGSFPLDFTCWDMSIVIIEIYKDKVDWDFIHSSQKIEMSKPVAVLI